MRRFRVESLTIDYSIEKSRDDRKNRIVWIDAVTLIRTSASVVSVFNQAGYWQVTHSLGCRSLGFCRTGSRIPIGVLATGCAGLMTRSLPVYSFERIPFAIWFSFCDTVLLGTSADAQFCILHWLPHIFSLCFFFARAQSLLFQRTFMISITTRRQSIEFPILSRVE